MHYVLIYDVVDDYLERRGPLRPEHLKLATESKERGELMYAGAFDEPVDGALLVFKCDDASVPERFAKGDPYVREDLVTSWKVRKWTVVVEP